MKNIKRSLVGMTRLLAIFLLVCSWGAQATAPRIAPQLFGEEKKADIVGYQLAPDDAEVQSDGKLAAQIVSEAFKAAGKTLVVDVLPSKQLAKYALINNDALALIGSSKDVPANEIRNYHVVIFYLRPGSPDEAPVSLIFNKKSSRRNELQQAFNQGLQKLIKSGEYMELLEKHYGKGRVPADYIRRLQNHNPALK